jgi:hypothetical protein
MSKRGNSEGSLYRRKDGRWTASVDLGQADGRRRRKSFYGRTRQEVAHKLQAAQRAVADGLPLVGQRQTTGDFLEVWLRDSVARKVRPKTLQRYQQIVKLHLTPRLGRIPLAKLTPAHVERMINEAIANGASPRSACHHRAVLRAALGVAMRWGLLGRNVAALAGPPHVPGARDTAPGPARRQGAPGGLPGRQAGGVVYRQPEFGLKAVRMPWPEMGGCGFERRPVDDPAQPTAR